jgi:N-acetyl-1-D-myo-inositol-2-amino-2-deoxy-alpha-D-glucopyranoside deacetylase
MHRLAGGVERYVAMPTATPRPLDPGLRLPWRPPVWLRPWLRISVASRQGMRSWRWRDAPLQRDGDGAYRLVDGAGEAIDPRFIKLAWDRRAFWIFDHWGWRKA